MFHELAIDEQLALLPALAVDDVHPVAFRALAAHLHACLRAPSSRGDGHALGVQTVGHVGRGRLRVGSRLREAPEEIARTRKRGTGIDTVADRNGEVGQVAHQLARALRHVKVARAIAKVEHPATAHLYNLSLVHQLGGDTRHWVDDVLSIHVLKVELHPEMLVLRHRCHSGQHEQHCQHCFSHHCFFCFRFHSAAKLAIIWRK